MSEDRFFIANKDEMDFECFLIDKDNDNSSVIVNREGVCDLLNESDLENKLLKGILHEILISLEMRDYTEMKGEFYIYRRSTYELLHKIMVSDVYCLENLPRKMISLEDSEKLYELCKEFCEIIENGYTCYNNGLYDAICNVEKDLNHKKDELINELL